MPEPVEEHLHASLLEELRKGGEVVRESLAVREHDGDAPLRAGLEVASDDEVLQRPEPRPERVAVRQGARRAVDRERLVERRVEGVHAHRREEVRQEAIRDRRHPDRQPGKPCAKRLRLLARPVQPSRRAQSSCAHRARHVEDEERRRVVSASERGVGSEDGLRRRETEQQRQPDEGDRLRDERASVRLGQAELREEHPQPAPAEREDDERHEPHQGDETAQRSHERHAHLSTRPSRLSRRGCRRRRRCFRDSSADTRARRRSRWRSACR